MRAMIAGPAGYVGDRNIAFPQQLEGALEAAPLETRGEGLAEALFPQIVEIRFLAPKVPRDREEV